MDAKLKRRSWGRSGRQHLAARGRWGERILNRNHYIQFALLTVITAGLLVSTGTIRGQVSGQLSPVTMPVTLLDLYRHSDAVFEARYDRTEDGEVVREDEDYSVVRMKKHFDVYSTLKGGNSKFFVLSEEEYRYPHSEKPNYLVASTRAAADDDVENTYGLRSGDSVLLFLKFGPDGKTLELTDEDESVKKLSSNDIAVYEKRIRELSSLLSSDTPSVDAIVQWMMRCAEEPATRWEATFELVKGFERIDWQQKQAAASEPAKAVVNAKPKVFDSAAFARALTAEQKHRLADILLDQRVAQVGENGQAKRTYVRGDRELIDLVRHWGDPRLAGFLLEELRTKDLTDYRRSETMRLIADMLGDPSITGLADKYSNAYRDEAAAGTANSAEQKPDYHEIRAAIVASFIKRAGAVVCRPGTEN